MQRAAHRFCSVSEARIHKPPEATTRTAASLPVRTRVLRIYTVREDPGYCGERYRRWRSRPERPTRPAPLRPGIQGQIRRSQRGERSHQYARTRLLEKPAPTPLPEMNMRSGSTPTKGRNCLFETCAVHYFFRNTVLKQP